MTANPNMDNRSTLLELARQKFSTLSEADEKLFSAVAKGELADYSAEAEQDNDPPKAERWGEERILKADRIYWLCTDKVAAGLVKHKGISVKGAHIDDELELEQVRIPFRLVFHRCFFSEVINLLGAEIRSLNLTGTHTGPIHADGLTVDGYLFLRDGFKAKGIVRLLNAKIGQLLDCSKGQFINQGGRALAMDGLKVNGGVFLQNGFEAHGMVSLVDANIGGGL